MNSAQSRSKTQIVLIGLGVVAALVILGGAGYAIYTTMVAKTADQQSNTSVKTVQQADFTSLKPALVNLQDKMKKVDTDHQKAQAAVDDASKRIKLTK